MRVALTEKFGGVTAFLRSPAVGISKENDDDVSRDDVVMFEVMVEELDESWWSEYREGLERAFRHRPGGALAIDVLSLLLVAHLQFMKGDRVSLVDCYFKPLLQDTQVIIFLDHLLVPAAIVS